MARAGSSAAHWGNEQQAIVEYLDNKQSFSWTLYHSLWQGKTFNHRFQRTTHVIRIHQQVRKRSTIGFVLFQVTGAIQQRQGTEGRSMTMTPCLKEGCKFQTCSYQTYPLMVQASLSSLPKEASWVQLLQKEICISLSAEQTREEVQVGKGEL